jgi:hypothetical protein
MSRNSLRKVRRQEYRQPIRLLLFISFIFPFTYVLFLSLILFSTRNRIPDCRRILRLSLTNTFLATPHLFCSVLYDKCFFNASSKCALNSSAMTYQSFGLWHRG